MPTETKATSDSRYATYTISERPAQHKFRVAYNVVTADPRTRIKFRATNNNHNSLHCSVHRMPPGPQYLQEYSTITYNVSTPELQPGLQPD